MVNNSTFILLATLLFNCSSVSSQQETLVVNIDGTEILQYESPNIEINKAVKKIAEYLKSKRVPIDSMYLANSHQAAEDEWIFRVVHFNYYVEHQLYKNELARKDSLKSSGVKNYIAEYTPPSGNWGGHDRTIFYSPQTASIIEDMVDQ